MSELLSDDARLVGLFDCVSKMVMMGNNESLTHVFG